MLNVGQIDLYTNLIEEEFKPVIEILEERNHGILDEVVKIVKTDLGVYKLRAKERAIEEELNEIKSEIENLVGSDRGYSKPSPVSTYLPDSPVGKKVERLMNQFNKPLGKARDIKYEIVKRLKLSGASNEVVALFEDIKGEIADLTKEVAALPPVESLQITVGKTTKKKK
ncbi:MAG TPA: hypothetical protein ENI23_16335 [bacterium]|nr:hypothetical protein [bacterium]